LLGLASIKLNNNDNNNDAISIVIIINKNSGSDKTIVDNKTANACISKGKWLSLFHWNYETESDEHDEDSKAIDRKRTAIQGVDVVFACASRTKCFSPMRCCGFWHVYHAPNVSSQSRVLSESLACVSLTEFVVAFFDGIHFDLQFQPAKTSVDKGGSKRVKKQSPQI
jgi:hypothetical protein